MTGNVVYLSMLALGNLPERKVLREVDRWIDTYFFHRIVKLLIVKSSFRNQDINN